MPSRSVAVRRAIGTTLRTIFLVAFSTLMSFDVNAGATQIAAGYAHTVALKSDGSLWAWGDNMFGQLGDGTTTRVMNPKQIGTGFSQIAAGRSHTVALKADGSLWAWGYNGYGQLGDGTAIRVGTAILVTTPKQIGTGFSQIAAGHYYTVALKADGSLWAWGDNRSGQLGDGTTTNVTTPKTIGTGFSQIAAGESHTVALKSDGSLWAWGQNSGKLGTPPSFANVTTPKLVGTGFSQIAAGASHTVALKSDNSLWAWGFNWNGQLGDGTRTNVTTPKQIGTGFSQIAAGESHTVALKSDGSLWAWGFNWVGQVGNGTTTDVVTPKPIGTGFSQISAGRSHNLALKTDGSLWAWGGNFDGQVGDGDFTPVMTPKLIGTGFNPLSSGVPPPIIGDPTTPVSVPVVDQSVYRVTDGRLPAAAIDVSASGTLGTATISATLDLSSGYHIYLMALVPGRQLSSSTDGWFVNAKSLGWQALAFPLSSFMENATVGGASERRVISILMNTDITRLIGTEIYLGYGSSDQEMLAARRYRGIYSIK